MISRSVQAIALLYGLFGFLLTDSACAKETSDELAVAFGHLPEMWGARLSPDGSHVSYLSMAEKIDVPIASVISLDGTTVPILASKQGAFDIYWCDWASNERLLCGFYGVDTNGRQKWVATRLVSVDRDGKNFKVLLQDRLARTTYFSQFQDRVVDWLPDEPEHVLVQMPDEKGSGVGKLNIYTGSVKVEKRSRQGIRRWLSDGRGNIRARLYMSTDKIRWDYRMPSESKWHLLYEREMTELKDYLSPIGFGSGPKDLLAFKPHNGRRALFERNLETQQDRLIYSHDLVDLGSHYAIGKYNRLVAVQYATDYPHYHYFDEDIAKVISQVEPALGGLTPAVIDESWDKTVYLLHADSDTDAGRYFRFDAQARKLQSFWPKHSRLANRSLSPMRPTSFPVADGVEIPAYLTLPKDQGVNEKMPTVILPHGGPASRDHWGFDWLVQFFAAQGYAVLQVNFRGSGGYGEAWEGDGGFRAWRQTISDITDGTNWLLAEGVADPDRLCIVGWSYGGYAALLSVLENPELYKCVVSIAGVTDPKILLNDYRGFLIRKAANEFVSYSAEVIEAGSPLNRAKEFSAPVLLFHGDDDVNVSVKHSKKLNKALRKANKSTELILYDDAEHGLWRNQHRVDMLSRIGNFLAEHIALKVD